MGDKALVTDWPCQAVEGWIAKFQQEFKEKFGADISTNLLIGLILTDWIASKVAEASVYGRSAHRWKLIGADEEGRVLTGEELYALLVREYSSALIYQRG